MSNPKTTLLRTAAAAFALAAPLAASGVAHADTGKLNLHADLAFGMPTASYLAPPGSNDDTGYLGAGLFLSVDYVVAEPFAIELVLGGGYMFDIFSGSPLSTSAGISELQDSGILAWSAAIGGRLRFIDNETGNLWLGIHGGVYNLDGVQFGADGAIGYDFRLSSKLSIGPALRYQIVAGGNSTPWASTNEDHFTSAIWLGASLGINLMGEETEEEQGAVDLDADDDGILDSNDSCPTEPEDFDQHNDEDGCPETETDIDGDGIQNEVDACPEVPEDRDSFQDDDGCPDPDNDADRVLDVNDRCPMDPEDLDGFQDDDGCPDPDNDADGVVDIQDNCPNDAGVIENRGCPDRDRDGDTVVDRLDNCPDEPGTVENHGCRDQQLVEIRQGQLYILEKIYFRVNSHVIERRSYPLLDQVAAVLNAHPEILRVRVDGHTDARGSRARNMTLSQRRVNSVVTYLTRKGVARTRLEAVGHGPDQPVFPNATTEEEHEANRRVEFVITEYAPVTTNPN